MDMACCLDDVLLSSVEFLRFASHSQKSVLNISESNSVIQYLDVLDSTIADKSSC